MKKLIMAVMLLSTALVQPTVAQTGDQQLNNVLTHYLAVKNDLTKDNGDSVQAAAKILLASIESMPMDKLTTEQHTIWMKYSGKLSSDARHIKETGNIDQQRKYFASLSTNMYKVLKELKFNDIDLYYQYCPMVQNYWISEKSGVVNPYLGSKMSSCGQTKETLKTNK